MTHLRFASINYLAALLVLAACPIPKSLGDNPDPETTAETTTDGSTAATTGAATTTTGDGSLCQNPAQMCGQVPLDCAAHDCGGLGSPFDADGCLRQACDGANPCPGDEVCFGDELAGCSASVVGCSLEDGACECFSSDDCGGRYCHPEGEAPPADCGSFTDEASCLAAGCTQFELSPGVQFVDGACTCGGPVPVCLWLSENAGAWTIPAGFVKIDTQEVVLLNMDWTPPPYGWSSCDEPGAPPACACASDCV